MIRPLDPLLAEKARKEINEDTNQIDEYLRTVKQWITEQPHLIARTDDQWLIAFLRGCKYNLNKVKKKLELYYNLKTTCPDIYCVGYSEPKLFKLLELGVVLIIPKILSGNTADPRLAIYRIGKCDTSKFSLLEIFAVLLLQFQICFMEDDNVTVSGMMHVIDLQDTGFSHYTQLSISQMRKLVLISQDGAPMRLKGIHFINNPLIFYAFFNIAKQVMPEKHRKRIHFHGKNYESFHKHISKESLPVDLGGTSGTIREIIDYWKIKMREYSSWFEEDTKYIIDESKRLAKNATLKTCIKQINEID